MDCFILLSFLGYCPLHHAAAWGHLDVLKILVEFNANLQQRNRHGERARETALRYNQTECVNFLDWAGGVSTHTSFLSLSLICIFVLENFKF